MIVFISCVKKKKDYPCRADEMYISDFFKKQLEYAKSLHPNIVYILSAKYGVLELQDRIEPYEQTLKKMSKQQKKCWNDMVIRQLMYKNVDFTQKAVFLCGDLYASGLSDLFTDKELPMSGMKFGERLKFMKERMVEYEENK